MRGSMWKARWIKYKWTHRIGSLDLSGILTEALFSPEHTIPHCCATDTGAVWEQQIQESTWSISLTLHWSRQCHHCSAIPCTIFPRLCILVCCHRVS